MKKRTKNIINKIICVFKGHIGLERDIPFTHVYVQEGRRFTYNGRLYHCRRCGTLLHFHGVTSWELEDLIKVTLKDLSPINLENLFPGKYDIRRLYEKEN